MLLAILMAFSVTLHQIYGRQENFTFAIPRWDEAIYANVASNVLTAI